VIHFAIGTKAQFIKMAPLMYVLHSEGMPYHLLDLSQHAALTGRILADFGLAPNITHLRSERASVTTYWEAARWITTGLRQLARGRTEVLKRFFLGRSGVALVHGDTLSTLLGLYLARRAGLQVGLVEAGLTSRNLFNPFPEEWIRRHATRRCTYLFAPDETAENWLRQSSFGSKIVNTGYNTGRDALALIARSTKPGNRPTNEEPRQGFGVVTLHRLETLSSRKRFTRAIHYIRAISDAWGPLRFYLHPPTVHALARFGLETVLRSAPNVTTSPLLPYPDFVRALTESSFVITDGGSVQEETAYLGKPCLILRQTTERQEGLGRTAKLASWDLNADIQHLVGAAGLVTVPEMPTLDASLRVIESLRHHVLT
jgi:UDP-N-acetylglucosamine 2-epimerase (non-hydrolysing)